AETGCMMSLSGALDDLKLLRVQVLDETGGPEQIWVYENGLLRCKVHQTLIIFVLRASVTLALLTEHNHRLSCFVSSAGGGLLCGDVWRLNISPEPGKENHFWSITGDGIIRNNLKPDLVLEVK
ncbi:hypothetical protein M9458_034636, partial [Cirrhinus mrigala]